ncbi:DNA-directed DNA polymerase [Wolffia australiana]
MGADGGLNVVGQIQSLVSDKLQVVSYKWLSRNFSVSSNEAKRLLEDFVDQHGKKIKVIYAVSGWLKENPEIYNIKLVSASELEGAKQKFRENFALHVYSVQASIPKDPAAIWNSEFLQSEELYDQPMSVENCLRDNRFCGISNPLVARTIDGKSITVEPPTSKKVDGSNIAGPKAPQPLPDNSKSQKEKMDPSISGKVNQADVGRSLTNMWGRASAKSKPQAMVASDISRVCASSDGQISAQEALESVSSDDEWQVGTQREAAGPACRKRRMVLDSSDEEDEVKAVDLTLPEPSICQTKARIFEEKSCISVSGLGSEAQNGKKDDVIEGVRSNDDGSTTDLVTNRAATSPKMSKILKTRIDERGREVTEVVLEGKPDEQRAELKTSDTASKEGPKSAAISSPAVPRHAPPAPAAAKAGGGKTAKAKGAKDTKQPNIFSFFKKA